MEIVRGGGADRLTRSFSGTSDKQAAAFIITEPLGQTEQATLEGLRTRRCPSKHAAELALGGTVGVRKTFCELLGAAKTQSFSQEGYSDD